MILNKFGYKCAYCGCILITKTMHIDHIKPTAAGGTDAIENLNPSCYSCNNYKSNWTLEEFREHLKILINERYEYLFKSKTKMKLAIKFGEMAISTWDGYFYFETRCDSKVPDEELIKSVILRDNTDNWLPF